MRPRSGLQFLNDAEIFMPLLVPAGQPTELAESLGRAVGVDGAPAQVSARYIPGRQKVNYRVYSKPTAKLGHQPSGHQALAIRHDLPAQSQAPRHV